MALLPVAPIKVKYHVCLLLSLTNAFVDVFNNDSAFTFSQTPVISLSESVSSGSVCNFVLNISSRRTHYETSTPRYASAVVYTTNSIYCKSKYMEIKLGAKMALLPVAPIKAKHDASLLRSLTNAFVDVFNSDCTFTLTEVPVIRLTEFATYGSVYNFVAKNAT